MITAEYLQANGYEVSLHVKQPNIDRAEAEVVKHYFEPLALGDIDYTAEPYKSALLSLVFLLLAKRNTAITRTGSETKLNEYALKANEEAKAQLTFEAGAAYRLVEELSEVSEPEIVDIAGIKFKTNYF